MSSDSQRVAVNAYSIRDNDGLEQGLLTAYDCGLLNNNHAVN